MKLFKKKGLKGKEIVMRFLDEASPQLTANTVRVWSFGKVRIKKNTQKMKSNTIGFYAIKGYSVLDSLSDSKADSIAKFMEKIKSANQEYKTTVVILDNFPSHKSRKVKEKALEYGIYPVFLPPYSPDLNPIEFIWKSIKRVISLKFIKNIEELKSLIEGNFITFAQSLTYAKNWMLEFEEVLSPI